MIVTTDIGPRIASEQKIGVTNKQGWVDYYLVVEVMVKKFDFKKGVIYSDYHCNNEVYIAENYLEIETLSSLTKLALGEKVEHIEHWLC